MNVMWFLSITEKFLISINSYSCSLSYLPSCVPFNLNTPLVTILQTVSCFVIFPQNNCQIYLNIIFTSNKIHIFLSFDFFGHDDVVTHFKKILYFLDGFVSESNKVFGDINTEQTRAFVGITFPVKNILAISGSLRETSVVEKLTVKIGACTEFLLLNIQQLFMHIFLFIPEQSFFFICRVLKLKLVFPGIF